MQLLEFIPLYMKRVWGGQNLQSKLGRKLPKKGPIGESWDIVDRPEAQSIVAKGPFAGQTIRELLSQHASDILGPGSDPSKPFPILVKWLDCQQRLSLQVHPSAETALLLNGEPKIENCYIVDADNDASMIVGLKQGTTRKQLETALANGQTEDYMHRFTVKPGDSIFVESGCVHSFGTGNLILEIQQNSDTTYRIHDWERSGMNGFPRELHIDESLKSINFDLPESKSIANRPGNQILSNCDAFRIRKFDLIPGGTALYLPAGEQARLIHIVSGTVIDKKSGQALLKGNNYIQPYISPVELVAESAAKVLITDKFKTFLP